MVTGSHGTTWDRHIVDAGLRECVVCKKPVSLINMDGEPWAKTVPSGWHTVNGEQERIEYPVNNPLAYDFPEEDNEKMERAKEIVDNFKARRAGMKTNTEGKVVVHLRPEEVEILQQFRGVVAHVENAAGVRQTYTNNQLRDVIELADAFVSLHRQGSSTFFAKTNLFEEKVRSLEKVRQAATAWLSK